MDLDECVSYCYAYLTVNSVYSFKSVTIPARDDPHLAYLAKRCDACKPLGMYRSQENEFLLVYDGKLKVVRISSSAH